MKREVQPRKIYYVWDNQMMREHEAIFIELDFNRNFTFRWYIEKA